MGRIKVTVIPDAVVSNELYGWARYGRCRRSRSSELNVESKTPDLQAFAGCFRKTPKKIFAEKSSPQQPAFFLSYWRHKLISFLRVAETRGFIPAITAVNGPRPGYKFVREERFGEDDGTKFQASQGVRQCRRYDFWRWTMVPGKSNGEIMVDFLSGRVKIYIERGCLPLMSGQHIGIGLHFGNLAQDKRRNRST